MRRTDEATAFDEKVEKMANHYIALMGDSLFDLSREDLVHNVMVHVAFGLAPPSCVVVDRARFERLREFASAHVALDAAVCDRWHANAIVERAESSVLALQSGDLDPLP